jgi:hypothetical protein
VQSGRRIFIVSFLAFSALLAAWSFANPLFSAPDEESHVNWAAALDAGRTGAQSHYANGGAVSHVFVPPAAAVGVNAGSYAACFKGESTIPADCAPEIPGAGPLVSSDTHSAEYPPLYYYAVGTSLLFNTASGGLYGMRIVGDLMVASLLAAAVTCVLLYTKRRFLLAGLAIAMTGQVLYLGSIINPSGLEIAAALCLWTAGAILVTDFTAETPKGLVVAIVASASVLVLTRSLSPLNTGVIGLILLLSLSPKKWWTLMKQRRFQFGLACVVVASLSALLFLSNHDSFKVVPHSSAEIAALKDSNFSMLLGGSFDRLRTWMDQSIVIIGWLSFRLSDWFYLAWYAAMGFLILWALIVGRIWHKVILLLIIAAVVVGPCILVATQAPKIGYVWQGRDGMPLFVGIPIFAAAMIGAKGKLPRLERFFGTALVIVALAANLGVLYAVGRRYSVGTNGSLLYFVDEIWQPAVPSLAIILIATGATCVLIRYATLAMRQPTNLGSSPAAFLAASDGAAASLGDSTGEPETGHEMASSSSNGLISSSTDGLNGDDSK